MTLIFGIKITALAKADVARSSKNAVSQDLKDSCRRSLSGGNTICFAICSCIILVVGILHGNRVQGTILSNKRKGQISPVQIEIKTDTPSPN